MEANTENTNEEYSKRMDHFPCAFNLTDADKVTTAKLRSMQHNLDSELDINDGDEDERIIKLNLLTWVRFRLEKHDEALQLSNDVVDLTKRRNVASLGNRVFVSLQIGDEVEAMKCLKDLEKLKSENNFHTLHTDAQAEQAYYYSRLGRPNNLQRAIDILSALPETSINYARKYRLGLMYSRATNTNIYCSRLERLNVKEYEEKAAECLLHVAENADNRLRSLAYAQLATLRRNYPTRKKLELFRGLSVEELCEKALQHEQNIPSVLAVCGKAIKPINIDKAIQWLRKSVEIKETSPAYHHLGICYKRKADQAAKIRYQETRIEERPDYNGLGQVRTESQFPEQSNHGSSGSVRNKRYNRRSAQRFESRGRTARGIGLARGNTQSMNRYDRNSNQRDEKRAFLDLSWKPKSFLKSSVRGCRNTLPLSKDDENVQEAQKYFKKAIVLAEENLPAVLDLGLLLKETNQINDALKQFNSITINYNHSITHRATVISAFEQAGLCYLQLSETESNDAYKEMGKQKLTKAVSVAADLVRVMPELQCSHKEVWFAFTTLLAEIDKEQISDNHRLIQKFKILELAREYGDFIEIIQKLRQTGHEDLTNPDVIKAALCSYLELGQPDNALLYHSLVAMNPAVQESSWWDDETMRPLRLKVLLHAISARLREINESPTDLFQQLFELVFGSCIGVCNLENDQQTDTSSAVSGDVLFVFETNDTPEEESTCPTVKSARCLKRVTTFLFGLQTKENSKGTGECGHQCTIQLKEMLKYQLVIIVLGNETRDGYFNAVLETVSYNKSKQAPTKQKIVVIDAGLPDGDIPLCLKPFRSLKLADLGILGDLQTAPESWDDSEPISFTDIINRVFDGNVEAIMKLFCFLIDQTWPCP